MERMQTRVSWAARAVEEGDPAAMALFRSSIPVTVPPSLTRWGCRRGAQAGRRQACSRVAGLHRGGSGARDLATATC